MGLKKSSIFSFLSSVRLAVPLLLIIAVTIAYGTILESQYNSDYAKLIVYQATWFEGLMLLLWINILCATISRIPFRKHHTGFVITHIGLLTLLIGALVTSRQGIDGQLAIREGTSGRDVVLNDLIFEVNKTATNEVKKFNVKKSSSLEDESYFSSINANSPIKILKYKPFVEIQEGLAPSNNTTAGFGIEFEIKNRFATQTAWLQIQEQPSIQMGPATFMLANDDKPKQKAKLLILDAKSDEVLKEIFVDTSKSNSILLKNIKVTIAQVLEQGVVVKNKITEGGKKGQNPALELLVEQNGKKSREVVFALFPGFSMNTDGLFGLKFKYEAPSHIIDKDSANTVAFNIDPHDTSKTTITLTKNEQQVLKQDIKVGDYLQTPWMGMQIKVLNVFAHALKIERVQEAVLKPKMAALPPSAVYIQTSNDEGFWLPENSSRKILINNSNYEIFYGSNTYRLPYSVELQKFTKTLYPGSATPMTFESDVMIENEKHTISMNEPLKRSGFTLYQSSYIENQGEAPVSVFSVNQDPGRPIKYAGSLILALGIIIFTIMRSGWYRKWSSR